MKKKPKGAVSPVAYSALAALVNEIILYRTRFVKCVLQQNPAAEYEKNYLNFTNSQIRQVGQPSETRQ